MNVIFTEKFVRNYEKAPSLEREKFDKQLKLLQMDIRHPSLHAKIVNPEARIWQARINGGWRFYFKILRGTIYLLEMRSHPK